MKENKEPNVSAETETKEEKKKKPVLIIVLILIIIALVGAVIFFLTQDNKTAVIVETDAQLQDVDADGKIRVKMNPYVYVKEGTMQNLEFYNLNEGRLLKLKINVGTDEDPVYVYESPFLEEGQIIKADVIDTSKLSEGDNDARAEIYSYKSEDEFISQTNVLFTLNCDK